jgi:hypothetical protein
VAISESLCWEVLRRCEGESVLSTWLKGSPSTEPDIQNALPLIVLEKELVLRHTKHQIEDSLYFLEKRGYLLRHGFYGLTRVVFRLSDSALLVLKIGSFSADEQQAFREALIDARNTSLWGMKFNLGEVWRRLNKLRRG